MNEKKQWDGYKEVTKLSQEELDELKCREFDTNMPDEYSNEEIFEQCAGIQFVYEDFFCNM